MKTSRKLLVKSLLLASLLAASISARATVETTSPAWIATGTTIQGNGGAGLKFTSFSQRLIQPIAYAGTVSSLQNSSLTDTAAGWNDHSFGTNGTLAYVEFNNGWMADIVDSSAADHRLILAGSLVGVVSVGDAYRVRPHTTIGTLFGANNTAGLKPGLNASQADTILVQIPLTQQTLTIFYFSNAVAQGWYRADFSAASNQVIYPEQGLLVRRIAPGNLSLFSTGTVKSDPAVVPIERGLNLVGTLQSINNLTLPQLNLYTGNPLTGINSGLNPALADNILVLQPDGSTSTYFYYKDTKGNEAWLDSQFNLANAVQIQAGSAFFINRKSPNDSFNWTVPSQ